MFRVTSRAHPPTGAVWWHWRALRAAGGVTTRPSASSEKRRAAAPGELWGTAGSVSDWNTQQGGSRRLQGYPLRRPPTRKCRKNGWKRTNLPEIREGIPHRHAKRTSALEWRHRAGRIAQPLSTAHPRGRTAGSNPVPAGREATGCQRRICGTAELLRKTRRLIMLSGHMWTQLEVSEWKYLPRSAL